MSDLVGRHMRLKRSYRGEFVGLCPFHQEKTASFTVNNVKGFFHCFGCGAHGDVIDFTQRLYRMPFRGAVTALATEQV